MQVNDPARLGIMKLDPGPSTADLFKTKSLEEGP